MLLGVLLLLLEHLYFKFVRPRLRKWDKGGYCGLISLVSFNSGSGRIFNLCFMLYTLIRKGLLGDLCEQRHRRPP
jgi:hypothetical protein